MLCKECDIPACVKCITSGSHQSHHFIDLLETLNFEKNIIFQELETSIYPPTENSISDLQLKLTEEPNNHEKLSHNGHNETASALPSPLKQKQIDSLKVRFEFHTKYAKVYYIAYHSPDDMWVKGDEANIKRFNYKGSLQEAVTTSTGYWPGGMTVTLQGKLIYTDPGDKNIYIVKNGTSQKMITVHGWRPRKVHYTASGDLLVSMHKNYQTPKKVVRYKGSTENQVLQFDQNGKPWFSKGATTLFIDENRKGDLCASDWKAKQIVVINKAGKLRFRYTGNLPSNKYKSFDPHGIATDSENQILVIDYGNNCIHIISEDGQFICYIGNCELNQPYDLCLDKNNTLYVTESYTAKVKMIDYMN